MIELIYGDIIDALEKIPGNIVTTRQFTYKGEGLETTSDYRTRPAAEIVHIGTIGGHGILHNIDLGDYMRIDRKSGVKEVIIGRTTGVKDVTAVRNVIRMTTVGGGYGIEEGFPRYVEVANGKGKILLTENLDQLTGDDVNDAPACANTCIGSVSRGTVVELKEGDLILLISNSATRKCPEASVGSILFEGAGSLFS